MLMPKRVKYRRPHRVSYEGKAKGGTELAFGEYGLKSLEGAYLTNRQIEAARIHRHIPAEYHLEKRNIRIENAFGIGFGWDICYNIRQYRGICVGTRCRKTSSAAFGFFQHPYGRLIKIAFRTVISDRLVAVI